MWIALFSSLLFYAIFHHVKDAFFFYGHAEDDFFVMAICMTLVDIGIIGLLFFFSSFFSLFLVVAVVIVGEKKSQGVLGRNQNQYR